MRKMKEEGCEGAGRSGSTEGGSVRSTAGFFPVFSKETMTKLCVGVFVLDILIYVFLNIFYPMSKCAHDTFSLPKSVTPGSGG